MAVTRPILHEVPLPVIGTAKLIITMSVGQWDGILAAAYEAGWTLLELNDDEFPVRAYKKETTH